MMFKKFKNKGFTLIELLAVIIILGVLMIIAVPSVTKYINDSRKNGYVSTAKEIAGGARNIIHSGSLDLNDKDTTYYINSECIDTSNSNESPYGKFIKAYVVVNYNDDGYDYYWVSVDETGNGVKTITSLENLDIDSIESNLTINDIPDSLGVDARHKYLVINKESGCTIGSSIVATSRVTEDGQADIIDYPAGKSKRTLSLGDIVTIGDQEFYYLSHNGTDTILIARYNLKVGKDYEYEKIGDNRFRTVLIRTHTSSEEGYGLQSSECLGNHLESEQDSISNCGVPFSSTNYWHSQIGEGKKYSYDYVYDENSGLYSYIENYKMYLENFGVNIKEARIIKNSDFVYTREIDHILCNTTYWNGIVFEENDNHLGMYIRPKWSGISHYTENARAGVRPVIVI